MTTCSTSEKAGAILRSEQAMVRSVQRQEAAERRRWRVEEANAGSRRERRQVTSFLHEAADARAWELLPDR